MRIIDSHAHLCSSKYTENDIELIVKNANVNGLKFIIDIGASFNESKNALKNATKYKNIFAAVGIHPLESDSWNDEIKEQIKLMAQQDKVVAIGEIGLDYYYKTAPTKQWQTKVFKEQLEIAKELKLPVSIHVRDAYADALVILKQFPGIKGVMHCFNGTVEEAKKFIEIGLYISFSGIITFENATELVKVAKSTPLSKMLVETDSPYLTPVPFRGKINQPEYISYTIRKIAKIKNLLIDDIEKQTTENAINLFKIR